MVGHLRGGRRPTTVPAWTNRVVAGVPSRRAPKPVRRSGPTEPTFDALTASTR